MFMNNEKLSYIEIVKKIDETFPLISEFDYRNLSFEDMWNKVYALISEIGLLPKMDSSEIYRLKTKIQDYHNRILEQADMVAKNPELTGYTQDNYYIGECVLLMKSAITSLLQQKLMIFFEDIESLDEPNNLGYCYEMGSIDEIRQFIDHDSIHKYVQDHLVFVKMDQQDYEINEYNVLDDICEHFGLEADLSFKNKFYNMFFVALYKSEISTGNSFYDDVEKRFIRETSHDSSRFNKELEALVKEVTYYIELNAKKCLVNRIVFEQRKSSIKSNKVLTQSVASEVGPKDDFINARESVLFDKTQEQFTEHGVTTVSPIETIASGDESPDIMVDYRNPSSKAIAELQENIIDKNEKLKELIKANEDILVSIKALTAQMEENLNTIKGIYGKK